MSSGLLTFVSFLKRVGFGKRNDTDSPNPGQEEILLRLLRRSFRRATILGGGAPLRTAFHNLV